MEDLPRRFGSKSAVHRWFTQWVRRGVFENIMRDAGELVQERGGFRLYGCFIDAAFSKARGGGDGLGVTKAGKSVKITVLVDARGLPVAVTTGSASPHESTLVQGLFDFMLTLDAPNGSSATRRTTATCSTTTSAARLGAACPVVARSAWGC